ncbi:mannonate dehydratase [Roseivivax isoporae]|uniref:Mannonate dehydratase n=1 Tax=Roseivivax isoporae LMG 25204 TaxID=1449351 RepID=X7F587_9RHOB|nr:mannonate dehydratase [Roseivivax isoporae]ETX28047.1 mannonate dehydratase [Roseivivax isoporae LMG 25204]
MIESWRWFGPDDPITLSDVRQAGARGVVTALHGVPAGTAWTRADVEARRDMIRDAGLEWVVVESIPVHEDIKTGAPGWEAHADAWADSLRVLGAAGIRTVCYNFMPVLDWTRTDLSHALPDGARCLRYDAVDAALFDIHVLERSEAESDHRPDIVEAAAARHATLDAAARTRLTDTIIAGLPGAEESWTLESFRARLDAYRDIGADGLRTNLFAFLDRVLPAAEAAGVDLAIHPDDPPFPLFGLPRVVSTEADLAAIVAQSASPANGITFCTGSLGVRADNDLPRMLDRLGDRVRFLHLRSTRREADGISFHEAEHLGGDARLVEVVRVALAIEARRGAALPMRPDHGHMIAWDQDRGMRAGYPYLGRMRGLAELRGVAAALSAG